MANRSGSRLPRRRRNGKTRRAPTHQGTLDLAVSPPPAPLVSGSGLSDEVPILHAENLTSNVKSVNYSRTFLSIISGVVSGIWGFIGLTGFVFYFLVMMVASLGLLVKAKFSVHTYFDSWNRILIEGVIGGLMVNCTASDHGNSQKQGMHFNIKIVQCVAPNQKEVLLKQTNKLCQGHADDKEISIEEAEASSPHGSAIDYRQIEFDSCPRISGEGRITKKQKDVARDKATCQKRPKHMQDHPMKVGSKVLLMTAKYPNKEIVAYTTIISTNPKANVGGVETGKQFYKVRINHPVEKDEPLVRPMPTYNNIGDAHAKGVPIAWPSIFVQMING